MTMATTTTVQRDDAADCRAAFEKEWPNWDKYPSGNYIDEIVDSHWQTWQAAWKAAKGV